MLGSVSAGTAPGPAAAFAATAAGEAAGPAEACTISKGEVSGDLLTAGETGVEGSEGAVLAAGAGEAICWAWQSEEMLSNAAVAKLSFFEVVAIFVDADNKRGG